MKYLAHTKDGKTFTGEEACQELKEHLANTAKYAASKAAAFGAAEAAEVIGLLHDAGKYSGAFQRRIRGEAKLSAPHAMAGAYALHTKYSAHDASAKYYGIVIGSHHTGLVDWGTSADRDTITYCGKRNHFDEETLPFDLSLPERIQHKKIHLQKTRNVCAFQFATYLRMLFSVLVDSDFTDTEEFCRESKRELTHPSAGALCSRLFTNMPQGDGSKVNKIRAQILANCLISAEKPQGLFSLTVPTGGGKTFSS